MDSSSNVDPRPDLDSHAFSDCDACSYAGTSPRADINLNCDTDSLTNTGSYADSTSHCDSN